MMRYGAQLTVVVALITCMGVGCNEIGLLEDGPEKPLADYLDATNAGNWDIAYSLVSSTDRAARSLPVFKSEAARKHAPLVAVKTTYRILDIIEDGETATAQVEVSVPDFRGALAGALSAALSGASKSEIQKDLGKQIEDGEVPMVTEQKAFELVREAGEWRVFLDWGKQDRIAMLIEEAENLKKERKLGAALEKLDDVLTLDSELVEVQQARDDTANELAAHAEKQSYIDRLALFDLTAKYYETYSGRVPGVDFKLRNDGDRTLERVEVTVYFKSKDGTVIAEEDYHPVLVSGYSFGRSNKPLKPKYVWQMERGKFYQAKSVPDEWKEGAVSARITDIEFSEG